MADGGSLAGKDSAEASSWAVAGHLGEHQVLDAGSGYGFRLEASQRNTKGPACA
jgi:hypothetical protein